jgi:uncharacterized membrane protein required for colicin V production
MLLAGVLVIIGIKRGFIQEMFRCIAVAGGFVGALLLYKTAYTKLVFLKTPHEIKTVVAFVAVYLGLLLGLLLIGWFLKKMIHLSMLGWIDRIWGGVFGLVKAGIIVWICVLLIAIGLPAEMRKSMNKSKTYTALSRIPVRLAIPTTLKDTLPSPFRIIPGKTMDSIKNTLRNIAGRVDSLTLPGSGK